MNSQVAVLQVLVDFEDADSQELEITLCPDSVEPHKLGQLFDELFCEAVEGLENFYRNEDGISNYEECHIVGGYVSECWDAMIARIPYATNETLLWEVIYQAFTLEQPEYDLQLLLNEHSYHLEEAR